MKWFRIRSAIFFFIVFFQGAAAFSEDLPPIDARRFEIKPIQKSTSGKIYLFESSPVIPMTGDLVLVYDHEKPAMAFRVLKNDPQRRTFVGKRVRRYDQTNELKMQESYSALEKLADVLSPPPTVDAKTDPAQELGNEAALPASTPIPAPSSTSPSAAAPIPEETAPEVSPATQPEAHDSELDQMDESNNGEETDEDLGPLEVDESTRIDSFNNIISVSAGYYGNASNFSGSSVLSNGFSLSYGHVLLHDVFINRKSPQDSLGFEAGIINYRIINRDGVNDIYSMLPFYGNLLYQLHTSPSFSFNVYLGIQYNYMTSASNPGISLKSLQGPQPTAGVGAFYGLGPQWYLRADLGWDRITAGLGVKW